jgi:hypothetical protein
MIGGPTEPREPRLVGSSRRAMRRSYAVPAVPLPLVSISATATGEDVFTESGPPITLALHGERSSQSTNP